MYRNESALLGCECTLVKPFNGCRRGRVVATYGTTLIVRLVNGTDIVAKRTDLSKITV